MEFNRKVSDFEQEEEEGLDIAHLVKNYLQYWKWFLLSLVIGTAVAFYNLNFTRPQFEAKSTIEIKDESNGDNSKLSAFQDLGVIPSSKDKVEDEIEKLKSKSLISEVVKSLNLNIKFFTKKNSFSKFLDDNLSLNTEFYEIEEYENPPLKINFFKNDSAVYKISGGFYITINSTNRYTFTNVEKTVSRQYTFGEKIKTDFDDIIITPNLDLKENKLIGETIAVSISPLSRIVNSYSEKIAIDPKSKFSSILYLTISDGTKKKAEDFLNELVYKYNERSIVQKEELTKSTSDFVNKRLEIIFEELSNVDLTAESIKTRYRLSDVASETGLNMEASRRIENQIVDVSAQIETIGYVKDYVSNNDDNSLIPSEVGVNDNQISASVQQYNEILLEKKRLLKNSTEKNPIVVNIDEQLNTLRSNIKQGLDNLETTQKISLDALNNQSSRISSRLYSAPRQERQIRDIKREQQIKEQLYLYLLQKREETAITLGVAEPNAEIIDYAESSMFPKSPKKKIYLVISWFIAMLIPFGIIYLLNTLDNKIHTKEEVEKALSIPIIGDIPLHESKTRYLIKTDDYSPSAEAFRILRTNLSFILPQNDSDKGKVIFVTSTIAHEGKSLVSSNLAASLAYAGKKTLIIGLDIRAPKIEPYLGIKAKVGVTNYVINSSIAPEDIVVDVPKVDKLKLISSGDLAPNPAELLMSKRIKELFDYARNEFEYIIVDTAAFSMVTDTLLLSSYADAFIYVIRLNFLDKRMLKYIRSVYNQNRLPKMSLMINGVDHKKSYGYGYGYGTNYEKSKKKWWKK